jgi:hypothetical protein
VIDAAVEAVVAFLVAEDYRNVFGLGEGFVIAAQP